MKGARLPGLSYDEMPPLNAKVQVLVEENGKQALLTSLCRWSEGGWIKAFDGLPVNKPVIAWRFPDQGKAADRILQNIIKSTSRD